MTSRPYGAEHERDRRRLLAELVDGQPCELCGRGMFSGQRLDADHVHPVALGGQDGPRRLVHARCNQRRGQKLGAALRARGRSARPEPNAGGLTDTPRGADTGRNVRNAGGVVAWITDPSKFAEAAACTCRGGYPVGAFVHADTP